MTTSSGYVRAGSKSFGLCRMPPIAAPSWLFHETTSSVLVIQLAACAFMSVSFFSCAVRLVSRGVRLKPDATYPTNTSDMVFESARRHAYVLPSFVIEKLELTV